jgi:hypothetical protein
MYTILIFICFSGARPSQQRISRGIEECAWWYHEGESTLLSYRIIQPPAYLNRIIQPPAYLNFHYLVQTVLS